MSNTPLITIADRYIFRELLRIVLFGVFLFTVIWLAPETMFKLISYYFDGKTTLWETITLFLYHVPGVLQQTIPMAIFLASVFLFRRFSQQMELVSFMNATITTARLMVPVAAVGLLGVLVHLGVQEILTPAIQPKLDTMYTETGIKDSSESNFVYVEKDPNNRNRLDKFFMIGKVQPNLLQDFIILYYTHKPGKDGEIGSNLISRILRASEGRWSEKQKEWQLFNGIEYALDEDGVYRETRPFKEQWVNTSPYAVKLLAFSGENPSSMSIDTLGRYLELLTLSGQNQDVTFFSVRFHQKIAIPLAGLIFAILGAFLGMEPPRSSGLMTLTTSAFVLFMYGILIPFATNLGSLELLPPLLAAWLPVLGASAATLGVIQWRNSG